MHTMILRTTLALLAVLALASCTTTVPQRYAMVTGLKPSKEKYYRELHAKPWPSVMAKLRDCNIRNYSIHRVAIEGKPYLFGYFEYTGTDFDADMKKMAAEFGVELQTTHPDEVAEMAVKGLEQDAFWLLETTADTDAKISARAQMILNRDTPVPAMVG